MAYHIVLLLSVCLVTVGADQRWVRFLVSVNDTWAGSPGCIATVATPPLRPDVKYNRTDPIRVMGCDHGPLWYTIQPPGTPGAKWVLDLTFFSSVIEDASPPTCTITWDGRYLVPSNMEALPVQVLPSLLPGCFTMDSREGYHMTYYWFYLLQWQL